ncbi:MAG: hypothetical protein GFH27_549325n86 [Chloroflexi bacterium AL-W]|nr:hypothetical protein [Chloroflexi bacterium AL-N1]NOK70064.1 hypothetical protein [Chloroflexi bacterium AL-N10]NOK77924.1 hypothetical protein [Chloroflexi bacterium AL-N5]NOK84933.1 hypothetical protein [Chloroflexi bacterium AL-W]NOK91912.1 hypothetical protein [Chloroflexi bacterium AL-N15]
MTKPLNLHIISHTHWDREWYLTFQQFRFRLVEMMDALLDLLERDPEFRYFHLDGQTIVLEDYLEIRPHREAALRALIEEGRILIGPWYVQPDEFLVSGEAIIRNLQMGLRIARRYGEPMMVGYLPDSFGHIAQLPQLMRSFGLDTFVHGRGIFRSQTGGTEYWWRGLDGSCLLGIFLATWYNNAQRFPEDPDEALAFVQQVTERLKQVGAGQDLILMNGVDHFVAQDNLTAIRRSLEQRLQEGRLIHARLPDVIEALQGVAGDHLRTVDGELTNEDEGTLLTGVRSARVGLKQANNAVERLLEYWVEPYETWASLLGTSYDRDFLHYAWKLLLQNHPHDSICGCSIDQVHREMWPRFDQATQVGEELLNRAMRHIAAHADTTAHDTDNALETTALLVHNPLPRTRNDVVVVELDFALRSEYCAVELLDDQGQPVPVQVLQRVQRTRKALSPIATPHEVPVSRYTVAIYCEKLPACGYRVYTARLLPQRPQRGGSMVHAGTLENEYLRVTVAADSTLTIVDKRTGLTYERLHFFRDEGDIGDQYNHIKPLHDTIVETIGQVELAVLSDGPVIAELELTVRPQLPLAARPDREGRADTTIEVPIRSRVRLLRGAERVEITTTIDNTVADHRLRVVFPLGEPITAVQSDTTFGAVERPIDIPSWWPWASRDRPHRSWINAQVNGRGLALLSRGLYEHDARADGQLELTLLRSIGYMFVDFQTYAPLDAVPEGQCLGTHRFEYAMVPHANDPHAALAEAAAAFNAPLRAHQTTHHSGNLPSTHSFLALEPMALQLTTIKRAEDRESVIVRCYNTTDETIQGQLRVPGNWQAAYRVNLDEQREETLTLTGDSLSLVCAPWQIITVELVSAV